MGKKDFDNLLKSIQGSFTYLGATIASLEVDFELPRGFIAKIQACRWNSNICR